VTRRLTTGGLVESLSVERARVVVEPRHERQRCVRLGDPDAARRPSSASDGSPDQSQEHCARQRRAGYAVAIMTAPSPSGPTSDRER
jgi:hypothetical protein